MEGKKVRFWRPRSSTCCPTPSLFTGLSLLAPPVVLGLLSISIVLASFSSSLSPCVAHVVKLAKSSFTQFPPAVLSPCIQPTPQVPSHIADYVNQVIIAALKSTAEHADFASHRAIIVPSLTTSSDELDGISFHNPDNVLTADLDRKSCWFFPESCGQVAIRVSQLIRLTHTTIDYLSPQETLTHHAPRRIIIWGLVDGAANKVLYQRLATYREVHQRLGDGPAHTGAYTFLPFANFTYDIGSAFPIQTFPSSPDIVTSGLTSGLFVVEV
ncbi:hypothetical protein LXA43DRAFT_896715 [Ganoderma leucocontextum]|nr:hypothetical protein LXA43DRAFT_896715 [Ganoderma leucocontextum]